jgi:quercetin dioxygenase-like cupin family protein
VGAGTPIVARALGVGTVKTPFTVKAKPGSMIVDSITIKPGGNFGWHTHGSAVAVVITGGTLTVFDPSVSNCAPFKVSKGQSFVEPAGHLHLARNDGAKPVTLYAVYLGVPKGVQPHMPGTQPRVATPESSDTASSARGPHVRALWRAFSGAPGASAA